MHIFLGLIGLLILAVLTMSLLNRYFKKSTREFALVRTGFGGRRVVLDGASLVLPFLHQCELISLRGHQLVLELSASQALITRDSLRADVSVEFSLRVGEDERDVSLAATVLGAQSVNSEDLHELLKGRLRDAIQRVVAVKSLADLHGGRAQFSADVAEVLQQQLRSYGLIVDAVSLLQIDQAPLSAFDQNNVFDAAGLRRVSESLSEQRLQRAAIEAHADVSVRETELESLRKRLELEQQQSDIELSQRQRIEISRAQSEADIECSRQQSQRKSEEARLSREREVRRLEIARDQALREEEAKALEKSESAQIEAQVLLSQRRADESVARAEAELKRAGLVQAQEKIQREKETLAAERVAEVAMIKQRHLNDLRAEESAKQEDIKLASAKAEAEIAALRAESDRVLGDAQAHVMAARTQAENSCSTLLLEHKLELEKVRMLPQLAKRMCKPLEKIESIRINHLGGLGGGSSGGGDSPLGDSLQQVLGMAVQLPAMKKLGEEIGMDFDPQIAGKTADAAGRMQGAQSKHAEKAAVAEQENTERTSNNPQENEL